MNKASHNRLIGFSPSETFSRVNGMLELLRSVDYSGRTGVMPENAEIALCDIFGMMQDALEYEASRESKSHTAAAGLKTAG